MNTITVQRDGRPATQEELQAAVDGRPLPPVPSKPLLSLRVARLERERDELADLCGHVLATIRLNWDRGTLYACPLDPPTGRKADEAQARFAEWLEIWEARFKGKGHDEPDIQHHLP